MKKERKIKQQELIVQSKEELDKEKAREHSIKEGSYAAIAHGTGHSYISPFAIALGASNAQIGILSSIIWIISPLAQLSGDRLMEKRSRKSIIIKQVFLEALMWITLLALALLAYFNIINYTPILLIILYSLLIFIGARAIPAWFSWMGDIVPADIRGRYFSKRNRITGTVALFSMMIAAFFLDSFKTKGIALIGFAVLFAISTIARMISAYLFTKKYEPKIKFEDGYYVPLSSFIKELTKTNFGKFTLYSGFLKLAVFIASPFFAVYMLRDLGLSYFWFTAITLSATIFTLLSLPLWGRVSDKYGNKALLKISTLFISLSPILWLFSRNPFYLMLVPGFVGGIGWSAFSLGSNNFIYDTIEPQKRGIFSAYYNLVIGIGIIIGGIIGSLLAQYLTISFMNLILFVFLISGILRYMISFILLPHINEIRKVKHPRTLTKAILKEIKPIHIHTPHNIFQSFSSFNALIPKKNNRKEKV